MIGTWSDSDFESSEKDEGNVAFTSAVTIWILKKEKLFASINFLKDEENSDSDESELTDESLSEAYKQMYESWVKVCYENLSLVKKNEQLSF